MARAKAKTKAAPKAPKARKSRGKKSQVAASAPEAPIEIGVVSEAPAAAAIEARTVALPECLDSSAATAVRDMLLAARGASIEVDAAQVRRVGAQSLQILVAASRTWEADGHTYKIINPSAEFIDVATLLGLSSHELSLGEIPL